MPIMDDIAKTIRALSVDAVEVANSGHPGLPLGMAEFGAWLFGERLSHNPANTKWVNRDRFILSAGHGSMLMYSLLHLSGYRLPLEEIKNFRQINSLTPGHPEYGHTDGVETTTGPLGQGFANAVGMAMGQAYTAAKFNTPKHEVISHYIYCLMGDGCMMEGISTEAASLAGHLQLNRLIAFYDSNHISIEGNTNLSFSEDVGGKFEALGWHVNTVDAYEIDAMDRALTEAQGEKTKPSLIILRSIIGKGAPNKAGTAGVHGAALGKEEIAAFRKNIGLPEESFYIAPGVNEFFQSKRKEWAQQEYEWNKLFEAWAQTNPALYAEWQKWQSPVGVADLESLSFPAQETGATQATRSSSGAVLQVLSAAFGNFIGGSADLAPSNNTLIKAESDFSAHNYRGRNLRFGVREHAMAAVANGLTLYGGLRTYIATFLVFSDYMRPSIRLAALMNIPVNYVFTHDSVFVGEDGPTHQPVEHLCALRTIPNLHVLRPGDAEETNEAWKYALLRHDGPSALVLTRQNLAVYAKPPGWEKDFHRGAYLAFATEYASEQADSVDLTVIVATGSEVNLAIEAAKAYAASSATKKDGASSGKGKQAVHVVSMPSREVFYRQDARFREALVPLSARVFVVEAGISLGWEGLASSAAHILSIDRFGLSAPGKKIAEVLGLTAAKLLEMMETISS